ncbi:MAG: nucleotidyltransferase [Candidatus Kapaibacteriales bacterium]
MYESKNIIEELKVIKPELVKLFGISELGIFGSFARGDYNAESDIDLLIDFSDTSDLYNKKNNLRQYLGNYFNKKIDLCRIKYVKPYFKELILNDAIYI